MINHENFPPLASAHLNPAASIFIPTQSTSNLLSQPRKEPNYSVRQRSSNIPVDNPEHEFQKTALDACRSTIAQQEAEIKKLNEGMDVRNKRILQLENQVGVATSYLSSRNCEKSEDQTIQNSSLNVLLNKVCSLLENFNQKSSIVNVYTNSCMSKSATCDMSCQTDDIIANGAVNMNESETRTLVVNNPNNVNLNSSEVLTCTVCKANFSAISLLEDHLDQVHSLLPWPNLI